MRHGRLARAAVAAVAGLLFTSAAAAHPAPFSFLDLRVDAGGIAGTLTVHDLDAAHDLGLADASALLDPATADRYAPALADLLARRLRLMVDGQPVSVTLSDITPVPDRQALRFTIATVRRPGRPGRITLDAALFPLRPPHQTFVNVYEGGSLRHQAILDGGTGGVEHFTGGGSGSRRCSHVRGGRDPPHPHRGGPSAVPGRPPVARRDPPSAVVVVSAFTLGHSLTLTLAALQLASPPASLIEPAIALSIVLVGADNLFTRPGARDLRPAIALAFGLIHGFGFAGVLREMGLPARGVGLSLFSFNLGVEIGQLAVVLVVSSALAVLHSRNERAGRRLAFAGSVVVAAAGAFWFIERVFFSGGIS